MKKFKTKIFIGDIRSLEDPIIIESHISKITKERQEKIEKIKSIYGKAVSLGAEILLRKAYFKIFGESEIPKIIKGSHGKPKFLECEGIAFNLSHSGDFVVCAFSEKPIGIDLQIVKPMRGDLVTRYFSELEKKWWHALPEDQKEGGFYNLWSCKESYIKYTGKGFSTPLNDFSVIFPGEDFNEIPTLILKSGCKEAVFLKKLKCPKGYVLWCCSEMPWVEENVMEIYLNS
ncbi:MAG: 4'-phosphopantetheinyl transferase family protein [Eubacteriaceae bacterium]